MTSKYFGIGKRESLPKDPNEMKLVARRVLTNGTGKVYLARLPILLRLFMRVAMRNPQFRIQLFRLVDVYPTLQENKNIYSHVVEYLEAPENSGRFVSLMLQISHKVPFGPKIVEILVKKGLTNVANLFIAGTTPDEIIATIETYRKLSLSTTVDILGEKTLNQSEADQYAKRVLDLVLTLRTEAKHWNPLSQIDESTPKQVPPISVSIKPTALSPHFSAMSAELGIEDVKRHLDKIFAWGRDGKILFFLDMEDYDVKDLTLSLTERLSVDKDTSEMQFGIVIQAYLKSAITDLTRIIEISRTRAEFGWCPLWIRLVKGAYFDTETVKASAEGWPSPTFQTKDETDYNFERCVDLMLQESDVIRPAFGTHNLRSISYVIAKARERGIAEGSYEIQTLYGMADSIAIGVRTIIPSVRIYLPMGELIPGMSYLVRRLIENTSNESFLRHNFSKRRRRSLRKMLTPPKLGKPEESNGAVTPNQLRTKYSHFPRLEFRNEGTRYGFERSITAVQNTGITTIFGADCVGNYVPLIISGKRIRTAETIESTNPANPATIVAVSASAAESHADAAVASANEASYKWASTPVSVRAEILVQAARWIKLHREQLGALEVLEAGKPWKEADADIAEAIDFLEFYSRSMVSISEKNDLDSPMGESNREFFRPRGVTAVIGPWNFPLAIPIGMVCAALVSGNCVVLKPAEQAPAIAFAIVRAFEAAGLEAGILNFLPGKGEIVGEALVEHKDVATIAFTGSYAVGTQILARASQIQPDQVILKHVIAEMGGKNPIIVDSDADLDQVIPGVLYSAFGFSGQKCSACSRVIVHHNQADELIERLIGAIESLIIGNPSLPETELGPLIDQESVNRVNKYVSSASKVATVIRFDNNLPSVGHFASPTLVINPPQNSDILMDEIFGPVLCVEVVQDINEAIARANNTKYALTAGLYSRSPETILKVSDALNAGNIYINRHITGAIPGRQPFGGFQHSGTGAKAGSKEYLLHFCYHVIVSENTIRGGFASEIK